MNNKTGKIIKIIALTICFINFIGIIYIGASLIENKVKDLGITVLVIGIPLTLLITCLFVGFATIVDAAAIYKSAHMINEPVSSAAVPSGTGVNAMTATGAVPSGAAINVLTKKPAEWTCQKCGSVQSAENEACTECGTLNPKNRTVIMAPADFFCEKCGARNTGTSKFCIKCGTQKKQQ